MTRGRLQGWGLAILVLSSGCGGGAIIDSGPQISPGILTISPAPAGGLLSLGTVSPGQSTTSTFRLVNVGAVAVSLSSVSVSGPNREAFAVASSPASPLLPGEGEQVSVTFTPPGPGAFSAELLLVSDGMPSTLSLLLSGSTLLSDGG